MRALAPRRSPGPPLRSVLAAVARAPAADAAPAGHDLRRVPVYPPRAQRAVELRPPGRGEASGFHRAQELVARLNGLAPTTSFRLEGRRLLYEALPDAAPTEFERQMRALIDRDEVLPMRLITRAGLSFGQPVFVDEMLTGYVDVDDLLASDDRSLQLNLVHILTERGAVRDYARRIGTRFSRREFDRAHAAGIDAEVAVLRHELGDPTLRFVREITRARSVSFIFESDQGYRVVHRFGGGTRQRLRSGELTVRTADGDELTIDEFLNQQPLPAAAAPAP